MTWLINTIKICLAIWFVYVFIFAIGLLSDSFQVLGGAFLNEVIEHAEAYLEDPFCGLCMGILLTVLCQSSSTATSIFITLVGSGLFTVKVGIYCIYGANVGTSITSTLVAFGNVATPREFKAGMACAAIPAVYDYLIVLVLFPLEIWFDLMEMFVTALAPYPPEECQKDPTLPECEHHDTGFDPIAVITEPIQQYILVINKAGLGEKDYHGSFVQYCKDNLTAINETEHDPCFYPDDSNCPPVNGSTYMTPGERYCCFFGDYLSDETFSVKFTDSCIEKEKHMFVNSCMSDEAIGGICFAIAFVLMYGALVGVVKCLKSVLEGSIQQVLKDNIDKNLPYPFGWLTEYLYVVAGLVLTIAVQSSSIVLAILTPIVAIGVVSIDRAYPITIGANIGTTITGLIAAFANASGNFHDALAVSLSHMFFNIFGFILFFLIPITRAPVIKASNWIGKMASKYRWWSIMYTILAFIALPLILFLISLFPLDSDKGWITSFVIMYLIAGGFIFVATITWLQQKHPKFLPEWWKNWKCLPVYCRSFEAYGCTPNEIHDEEEDEEKEDLNLDENENLAVENEAYEEYQATGEKPSKRNTEKEEEKKEEHGDDFATDF
ncbi:Oidioi.mRNA.OKI2018_I69.PAR.g10950.t1.cds [Oikopleura dioica]|uniref:Oidioi.mRNA.OKI2018_I69.PAR.g10950.t1.cds n=1 Tax=Oikopleura dioica TaxID=34765 RepID=A0ABN7RTB2_OIKDI|nr:Oidioi.mRNA.OKI2018_I69.PAR.g10950.t1.cds [Oikopleura dioica]